MIALTESILGNSFNSRSVFIIGAALTRSDMNLNGG